MTFSFVWEEILGYSFQGAGVTCVRASEGGRWEGNLEEEWKRPIQPLWLNYFYKSAEVFLLSRTHSRLYLDSLAITISDSFC